MLKQSDKTLLDKNRILLLPHFEQIEEKVSKYCSKPDIKALERAWEFGLKAHLRQKRHSGEPYFLHCLEVAKILTEMRMDSSTIIAALLHDVVEDTDVTRKELEEHFGSTVALLVDGVTKISTLKFQSKEARQAETFRKMLLSMAKDIRVIIIKFADRLHNMRTLEFMPEKKRQPIAKETLDVYAPLAHRLGIARMKSELEDLSLKYMHPDKFLDISRKIKDSQANREKHIEITTRPILKELKSQGVNLEIYGRPKSFYSIYNKMSMRKRPFEEIYDLQAIRIIVDKIEECYYALGIVHSLYMPVYDRFKDYIAMPKINGYQSLHTTVVGPDGKMVEIQIRTREMHQMAEDGIAAHWKYKQGFDGKSRFEEHLNWVKDLLERQMEEQDPGDFMEHLKINLYQDEVFVFTPAGDLIKLPIGSTAIDFAYAVHTNIGNHCIGAKLNGKIVALKTKLRSGQQVEIITSQNQHPSHDWLSFVKTSKARHWIKKVLKEEQLAQTIQIGEEILLKFLKKHKLSVTNQVFLDVVPKLKVQNLENLKVAIGRGEITTEQIFNKIFPEKIVPADKKDSFFVRFLRRARSDSGIKVQGMDNMLIHFARCCQPVPGDRIIGYLTRGKGVTIHRSDCKNMIKLYEEKERIIDVEWDVEKEQHFHVHLSVIGEDRKNLLKDITLCISKQEINIINVSFSTEELYAKGNLNIEVKNIQHLTKVINSIRKLSGVFSVERVEDAISHN